LVNEFGELPIDADLIESQDDNVIAIAGGCVCCSYGNDLVMAMIDLAQMEPRPQRVLLEASGVALPGAIASSIGLLQPYRLDGVIVLADAETVQARAEDQYMGDTIVRQLEDADLIILNKSDLVSQSALSLTCEWLADRFPNTRSLATSHASLPRDVALGPMQLEAHPPRREPAHHDTEFETLSFDVDGRVDPYVLADALANKALGVVRAKGFVRSSGGEVFEIQVVGSRSSAVPASAAKTTRIVCIGLRSRLNRSRVDQALAGAGALSRTP